MSEAEEKETGAEGTGDTGGTEQASGADAVRQEGGGANLLADDAAPGKGAPDTGDAGARAPEKYDLQAPDDTTWTPEQLGAFEVQARDLGLTGTQAQKLLEAAHANQRAALDAHAAQVDRWAEEVRMDKEMGGPHFEGTVMKARAALKEFDGEDKKLAAILTETGYGNHPEVVRFFARLHGKMGGDTFIAGKEAAAEKPLEERMYSNWKV